MQTTRLGVLCAIVLAHESVHAQPAFVPAVSPVPDYLLPRP